MRITATTIQKLLLSSVIALLMLPAIAQTDTTVITVSRPAIRNGVQVTGTVTDAATGKKLGSIRVAYKEYSADITDSNGNFSLLVPDYNVSVIASGFGYQSKEIALQGRRQITASLYDENYLSFYDVAVMPYNQQPKNQVPFDVSSVQTQGAWNRINTPPDDYLQGRVAGLNAIRRSGTPNIGANMFIRGYSSLYATNQPLIVIDGMIYDNVDYGGSLISNHYTNPLSFIDVKDIDNITVIKDGSSIYGTKGANGVILITTARAKELATRIDFATYAGVNFAPPGLPVMNASDYRTYLSEVLATSGLSESQIKALPYMNDDPTNPSYYRFHNNTDWQKQVFKNSFSENTYLKITGGDNIARYALSMGYLTNKGITKNTDLSRYNTRFNADLNLSRRLTAYTNLSFSFNEQRLKDQGISPRTNPIFLSLIKSPLLTVNEVDAGGVKSPDLAESDSFNVSNPVAIINNMQGTNKSYRFFGVVGFNYELSRPLHLESAVGVTMDKVRESLFIPNKGVVSDTLDNAVANSRLGSQVKRVFNLYNDTRLSYRKTFNYKHEVAARAGFRYIMSKSEQDFGLGFNSATDELVSVGNGVNSLRRTGGSIGEWRWLNTYVGADYNYSGKYFLSLNVATDGSSRFGKEIADGSLKIGGNQFAVLPSVAGAWILSAEKFMAGSRTIDLLKLRASWGLSGNDDIGNFTARQYYISQNLLGVEGLVRGNFGNPGLQWEVVQKINLGVDAALWNEKLNISLDLYRNNTDKMIVYEPTSSATGLQYAITNSGAMHTSGIELAVNSRIVNRASLKWDVGFTVAHYKSVIDKLPVDRILTNFADGTILTRTGEAPNLFYGYKTNGVYVSDAEAAQQGYTTPSKDASSFLPFTGGDIRFVDMNGDKIIDENDRQVIGNPNPDFVGSIFSNVTFKRWSFDALVTFAQGNEVYNYTRRQLESLSGAYNQTQAVVNRWRNDGHITNIPKAMWGDPMNNNRFSDRWIEDGSYMRLKTLSISYDVPFKPGFLKYTVIYLTGNNLFTLTKYLGYDPEFSATESVFGQGVDVTLEPQFRSVQLGVRIGL